MLTKSSHCHWKVRQQQLSMSYANPSFETNIHRGLRPVFWQEILLTRVYVAQSLQEHWLMLVFSNYYYRLLEVTSSPACRVYRIWEEVLQQPRCCLFVCVDEQQANCSKRYTPEFRKEQFSACSDAHIATWNLCRSWRLSG